VPSASGLFEDHADVGAVLHPGSLKYDPTTRTYVVGGSGENMWLMTDAFHFVWKKASGDVSLTADISFTTTSGNEHKKAVLMFRQSLDPGSAYAGVALHLSGMASLQYREEKGATTHEVRSNVAAPKRLRIVKRGDDVRLWLADSSGEFRCQGHPCGFHCRDRFTLESEFALTTRMWWRRPFFQMST
jgi:TolB protein